MAKRVQSFVHVHKTKETKNGVEVLDTRVFKPGEEVPADWAKFITNDKVWDPDSVADEPSRPLAQREPGTPPPLSGAGSSGEAWALYAAEVDVDIEEGATRDQIVEAIKAAGKPTERDGA